MSLHVNDGGTWKEVQNLSVHDGGSWKDVAQAWIKDGGEWKIFYPPESGYGWFGGNFDYSANGLNHVQRKDFTTDSNNFASRTSLPSGRGQNAAAGNVNFGYYCGGVDGSFNSQDDMFRIQFSNDSATPSNRGNLNQNKSAFAGVSDEKLAFFLGGNNTVAKLTFSSDTSTSTFTVSWTNRSFLSAVNSPTNGYFGGGYVSSNTWTRQITKIQFTNNTSSNLTGQLSEQRDSTGSVESRTRGYWCGGYTNDAATANSDRVDRLEFSNDTMSSIGDIMPDAIGQSGGVSNDSRGFICGGRTNGFGPGQVTTVRRLLFSNETMTSSSQGALNNAGVSLAGHEGIT